MHTRTTSAIRAARGGRIHRLLSTVAVLAAAGAGLGLQAPAAQAAVRQPAPVRIVLGASTTHVRLTLVTDQATSEPDHFGHQQTTSPSVVVSLPTTSGGVLDTPARSSTSTIRAELNLPARQLRLGEQRWEIEDRADGQVTGLLATVLRGSTVTAGRVVPLGAHRVTGTATVRHYEPAVNGYRAVPACPVQVQALVQGHWTTVATWRTDRTGTARGVATVPSTARQLRFARTDTLTDAGATSGPVSLPRH